MRLLVRSSPRAFALATDSHALIIENDPHPPPPNSLAVKLQLVAVPKRAGPSDPVTENGVAGLNLLDIDDPGPDERPHPADADADADTPIPSHSLNSFRPFYPTSPAPPVRGSLGVIEANGQVFLCVVHNSDPVAEPRPGEVVERIGSVEFYSLAVEKYDALTSPAVLPAPPSDPVAGFQSLVVGLQNNAGVSDLSLGSASASASASSSDTPPCAALKKVISDKTFYFSHHFDVTARLQNRLLGPASPFDHVADGWVWNEFMAEPMTRFRNALPPSHRAVFDRAGFLIGAIRGFASTRPLAPTVNPVQDGHQAQLTLISRLSCRRAGTRFNARGIDDDGNVANFVETETVLHTRTRPTFSYVQIRGTVPVFWEQAGSLIPGQQKIALTRGAEATEIAFAKHVKRVIQRYGVVQVVNLLSWQRPGEADLITRFHHHIDRLNGGIKEPYRVRETQYDFNVLTKTGYDAANGICELVRPSAEFFSFTVVDDSPGNGAGAGAGAGTAVLTQRGVFRTNCLDCLDRTNLVQTILGKMALEAYISQCAHTSPDPKSVPWETATASATALAAFWDVHNILWADNGDALSEIYAGTGALKSSFTRTGRMGFAGAMADAAKSATRMYYNNFTDGVRQALIDRLLGRDVGVLRVGLSLDSLVKRGPGGDGGGGASAAPGHIIRIWVGTFNLNGLATGLDEDVSPWLWPHPDDPAPDMFAVGLQEMVQLNAQQIMANDPARRELWERKVLAFINSKRAGKADRYVLLRGGQLVGAALSVFVRQSLLAEIKDVEASVKKTGLSGMAGNKGAVAIRLDLAGSSICLVTAHLAAGYDNVGDRNRDFDTITAGLSFPRGRTIESHDVVVWFGDFNYRVSLDHDSVVRMVRLGELAELVERDQLRDQIGRGRVFAGYREGDITFWPTYRFEIGSDGYARGERKRVPAWCDRILWKAGPGGRVKQLAYGCAAVRCSDHRPVFAVFDWELPGGGAGVGGAGLVRAAGGVCDGVPVGVESAAAAGAMEKAKPKPKSKAPPPPPPPSRVPVVRDGPDGAEIDLLSADSSGVNVPVSVPVSVSDGGDRGGRSSALGNSGLLIDYDDARPGGSTTGSGTGSDGGDEGVTEPSPAPTPAPSPLPMSQLSSANISSASLVPLVPVRKKPVPPPPAAGSSASPSAPSQLPPPPVPPRKPVPGGGLTGPAGPKLGFGSASSSRSNLSALGASSGPASGVGHISRAATFPLRGSDAPASGGGGGPANAFTGLDGLVFGPRGGGSGSGAGFVAPAAARPGPMLRSRTATPVVPHPCPSRSGSPAVGTGSFLGRGLPGMVPPGQGHGSVPAGGTSTVGIGLGSAPSAKIGLPAMAEAASVASALAIARARSVGTLRAGSVNAASGGSGTAAGTGGLVGAKVPAVPRKPVGLRGAKSGGGGGSDGGGDGGEGDGEGEGVEESVAARVANMLE